MRLTLQGLDLGGYVNLAAFCTRFLLTLPCTATVRGLTLYFLTAVRVLHVGHVNSKGIGFQKG